MSLEWLNSAVVCGGRVIRPALDPIAVRSEDLPDICVRMHLILDSIEFARCEGRLINRDIFEPIDTLYSDLLHKEYNSIEDWRDCIGRFGDYYELDGAGPIEVTSRTLEELGPMFGELKVENASDL